MTPRFLTAAAAAAILAGTTVAAQHGPAPTASKLPADVLALSCAPRAAFAPPDTPLRITGGQAASVKHSHAPGDLVTINAGRRNGIEVGQEFYTRRILTSTREPIAPGTPAPLVTTGWIRVYAVDDTLSLATITHACETIDIGDHLEPFALPTVPAVSADKPEPRRDDYGHVLTGDSRRQAFARGDFFLLDRGSDHGVTPGAQFVVYRNTQQPDNFLYDLGEAVAVEVTRGTSTLQVTVSRDAILTGDLVAIRK